MPGGYVTRGVGGGGTLEQYMLRGLGSGSNWDVTKRTPSYDVSTRTPTADTTERGPPGWDVTERGPA